MIRHQHLGGVDQMPRTRGTDGSRVASWFKERVLILGDFKFAKSKLEISQDQDAIRKLLQLGQPMKICHVMEVTWNYGVLTWEIS